MILSWHREESVRRYLAEHAGDKNNPMARAVDRQVSIVIFKPVE